MQWIKASHTLLCSSGPSCAPTRDHFLKGPMKLSRSQLKPNGPGHLGACSFRRMLQKLDIRVLLRGCASLPVVFEKNGWIAFAVLH